MILYTSDLHFGHANCIRFDKRPFENVDEMNRVLIENWNSRVGPEDDVYILGDFCYKSKLAPTNYLRKLRGHKYLVIGNHDRVTLNSKQAMAYFETADKILQIMDEGRRVVLCHYPIADWPGKHQGAFHLYGHIHNSCADVADFMEHMGNAYNVGTILHGYMPVSLDELIGADHF